METRVAPLSARMRGSLILLCLYLVAIVVALALTISNTPLGVAELASLAVLPIVALTGVCIFLGWRRSIWGYAGGVALGIVGICLRVVISLRPSLEVGGGLPIEVSGGYIALGVLLTVASLESVLELRNTSSHHDPAPRANGHGGPGPR